MPKKKNKIRPIAFVLPQFHPIPENDRWWGKGFTEWTNVVKAKPQFKEHYQPQIPTDLGFYDLRLPEARKAQADLAKEHGIYGFCYYHYWFNGKRLLNKPIDGMLEQKELHMPFMLCWANENWTRRWDGLDKEILIAQNYSQRDDENHIRWLCENVFVDNRYIKVDNCPVFLIYNHCSFPNIRKTIETWRRIARKEFGFKDLYICVIESFNRPVNPVDFNFDAVVEFSPHLIHKYSISETIWEKIRLRKKIDYRDYVLAVQESIHRPSKKFKLFRSVTPSWDNTARRGENAIIVKGSSPDKYEYWLRELLKKFKPFSKEENFIFINAMNEWAEGNHLEPCIKYGRAYLEATKKALEEVK